MNRLHSISGDCARLGYVPIFRHADCHCVRSVADAVQCHGIFGSGDKIQTSSNTQLGASEEAVLASGTGAAATREGDAQSVTGQSVAAKDSLVLAGSGNQNQLGGVKVGGNNQGAITINEAAGAEAIAQKFSDTIAQINSTASADKLQAQQIVSDALGKITSLSESKQTDGISALGKLVLYGLGLALLGLLIWRWNK